MYMVIYRVKREIIYKGLRHSCQISQVPNLPSLSRLAADGLANVTHAGREPCRLLDELRITAINPRFTLPRLDGIVLQNPAS